MTAQSDWLTLVKNAIFLSRYVLLLTAALCVALGSAIFARDRSAAERSAAAAATADSVARRGQMDSARSSADSSARAVAATRHDSVARVSAARDQLRAAEAEASAFSERMINESANSLDRTYRAIGLVSVTDRTVDLEMTEMLAKGLRESTGARVFSSFFTPFFVQDGLFERFIDGDRAAMTKLNLVRYLDQVLLVRLQITFEQSDTFQGVVAARCTGEMVLMDVRSRGTVVTATFSAKGVGSSERFARAEAIAAGRDSGLARVRRGLVAQ